MSQQLPPWPVPRPAHGRVVLRRFTNHDVHLAIELGDDPYIPLIGSLPAHPSPRQALEWIHRQHDRYTQGVGLSFAIADARTDRAVGAVGLWLKDLSVGRATAGYSVSPAHRGQGIATHAVTAPPTAMTTPGLSQHVRTQRGYSSPRQCGF